MPDKALAYAQMAEDTAKELTGSYQRWTAFLTTAHDLRPAARRDGLRGVRAVDEYHAPVCAARFQGHCPDRHQREYAPHPLRIRRIRHRRKGGFPQPEHLADGRSTHERRGRHAGQ